MSTALDLRLGDGRRVAIDSIHIEESTIGIVYASNTEIVWNHVIGHLNRGMPGSGCELPMFVVPPVSVRRNARVAPAWKVYVRLISDPLGPTGPLGGGSQLVLVFFCDDLASQPINEIIRWQLASLDEGVWRSHSWDWEP